MLEGLAAATGDLHLDLLQREEEMSPCPSGSTNSTESEELPPLKPPFNAEMLAEASESKAGTPPSPLVLPRPMRTRDMKIRTMRFCSSRNVEISHFSLSTIQRLFRHVRFSASDIQALEFEIDSLSKLGWFQNRCVNLHVTAACLVYRALHNAQFCRSIEDWNAQAARPPQQTHVICPSSVGAHLGVSESEVLACSHFIDYCKGAFHVTNRTRPYKVYFL